MRVTVLLYLRLVLLLLLVCVFQANAAIDTLHMMWTTRAFTFQSIHFEVLHRYLLLHPNLTAKLYITDTNWSYWRSILHPLLVADFSLELIALDGDFWSNFQCSVGEVKEWLSGMEEWKLGKYYYSHITDLLRFCLLWEEGGIYSDFDALPLRPFPLNNWLPSSSSIPRVVIGKDVVGEGEECGWCLGGGKYYLAPGVMIAEKGAALMKEALMWGFNPSRYDPSIFNLVGPMAVTLASKKVPKNSLVILERELFYPLNWKEAPIMFQFNKGSYLREFIERRAINLHLFGSQTGKLTIERDSALEGLLLQEKDFMWRPEYVAINSEINSFPWKDQFRWIDSHNLPTFFKIKAFGKIYEFEEFKSVKDLNCLLSNLLFDVDSENDNLDLSQPSEIIFEFFINENVFIERMPAYHLASILTITVKTMDRMYKVIELIDSLRKYYPFIPTIVSNDGEEAKDIQNGLKRGNFDYIALDYDIGLSAARNFMAARVKTPLLMILDDDFVFTKDSDLGYLVHQLYRHELDIVAASSPSDQSAHGIDYSGLLSIEDEMLWVKEGSYGILSESSCKLVDIVPNIFIAKTKSITSTQWDPQLKLGEHEDFFLRAKEKFNLKVATCTSISLQHNQEPHWLNKTPYDRMRSRVWGYLENAVKKHELRGINAFGMITMEIQPLDDWTSYLKEARIIDLQPFSVHVQWDCSVNYHFFAVDIFDITDCGSDEDPGILHHVQAAEPSLKSPITPLNCLVTGLDEERYYRIVVRPGNHTSVAMDGLEVILKTPPFHSNTNLIFNGDFAWGNRYWEKSIGGKMGIVSVRDAKKKKYSDDIEEEESIERRVSHPSRSKTLPFWDFAVSLFIITGPPTTAADPTTTRLSQIISGEELPPDCINFPCQLSLSGWCMVDRLFGPPSQLSLKLKLIIVWIDGSRVEWWEDWDPYMEGKWQMVAFSVGIDQRIGCVIDYLEVQLLLTAPRGGAYFDDIYLGVRPVINPRGSL